VKTGPVGRRAKQFEYFRGNPYLHVLMMTFCSLFGIWLGSAVVFQLMWEGDKDLKVPLPPAYFNLLDEYERRMGLSRIRDA
jgi:hypothetical protein